MTCNLLPVTYILNQPEDSLVSTKKDAHMLR